ncbi:MAG: DEAD/DEAH box helicase, partial [Treponema sp.]|nr:DEAD/DEAH box helicase [Treponema sp.]
MDAPETFHPIVRQWFAETYGKPTQVQARAWPIIERGENTLALAPTGSGKTLTAFLSAISRFCLGDLPADRLCVLYVSPLKALNEDIKRNLLAPLAAIRARFEAQGLAFPDIRAQTRSGDTPQSERRGFLARPPSILALTPESLAILLLNPKGRAALSTVKCLIIDEVHAILGNKRGAYLSCQIDRLARLAGEFQRVSLSATMRPPEAAAAFVAGLLPDGSARPIRIIAPGYIEGAWPEKKIDLSIDFSNDNDDMTPGAQKYGRRYDSLIAYILKKISANATLLVFTDSRRRAERLSHYVNQEAALARALSGGAASPVAFAHHGSLSKELRQSVERALVEGTLPCVIATASLELGIDIGSIDEVILAGSPSSVSQAMQRIGRSGHGVGQTSRGRLFPLHGMDLILACALARAIAARDIEETRPIENPLDILAQIIVALCAEKKWKAGELYETLRGFYIFRNLKRDSFDSVIRMLSGYGDERAPTGRMREVKPRLRLDGEGDAAEISGLDGNLFLLYSSGGVIANRGMYSMRLADSAGATKIGELDEEFVLERRVGDHFVFGGRSWQIAGMDSESVSVRPIANNSDYIPFWKADAAFRSSSLTKYVLEILDEKFAVHKRKACAQPHESALDAFLDSQKAAQGGVPLSGSENITVEIIDSIENSGDFYSAVIHAFRGGAAHYPFAMALCAQLEESLGARVEYFSNDDAMLFLLPRSCAAGDPLKAQDILRRAFSALAVLDARAAGSMLLGEKLFRQRLEAS